MADIRDNQYPQPLGDGLQGNAGEGGGDAVNHPPHYTQGDIECIDALEAMLGPEGFKALLAGNVAKYVWRHRHKGGAQDLRKARWYLDRLIEKMEAE